MANNYLQFSFTVDLPTTEAGYRAEELASQLEDCHNERNFPGTDEPATPYDPWVIEFCERHEYVELDATVTYNDDGTACVWLKSEECHSAEQAAEYVQKLLIEFDLLPVGFTYAVTCSKMRVDEFGGGGVVVTQLNIYFKDASQWVWQTLDNLKIGKEVQ